MSSLNPPKHHQQQAFVKLQNPNWIGIKLSGNGQICDIFRRKIWSEIRSTTGDEFLGFPSPGRKLKNQGIYFAVLEYKAFPKYFITLCSISSIQYFRSCIEFLGIFSALKVEVMHKILWLKIRNCALSRSEGSNPHLRVEEATTGANKGDEGWRTDG